MAYATMGMTLKHYEKWNKPDTNCMIPSIWDIHNRYIYRERGQVSGCQRLREEIRGRNWYEVSFWGDENVLKLDRGGCCTTLLVP